MLAMKGSIQILALNHAVRTNKGFLLICEIRVAEPGEIKEENEQKKDERQNLVQPNQCEPFSYCSILHISLRLPDVCGLKFLSVKPQRPKRF